VSLYTRSLPSSGYNFPYFALSGPEFADVRGRVNAFAGVAAYSLSGRNLTHGNGEAERVLTMRVTSEFFDVLGARPARGRTFTEEEAQRGGACLALLSHGALADAASAIGSTIRLDDAPCEVLGVMPEGFGFRDDSVKVWTALPINTEETRINRGSHGIAAIARLRIGFSAEQADAQLQSLRGYWSQEFPIITGRDILPSSGRCTRISSAKRVQSGRSRTRRRRCQAMIILYAPMPPSLFSVMKRGR